MHHDYNPLIHGSIVAYRLGQCVSWGLTIALWLFAYLILTSFGVTPSATDYLMIVIASAWCHWTRERVWDWMNSD